MDAELISKNKSEMNSIMAIDHSFNIQGKGTVFTGTVLQGSFKKGQSVKIPEQQLERQIKNIQCFHKRVNEIRQGDRAAILLHSIKNNIEKCLLVKTDLQQPEAILGTFEMCKYFKHEVVSG